MAFWLPGSKISSQAKLKKARSSRKISNKNMDKPGGALKLPKGFEFGK